MKKLNNIKNTNDFRNIEKIVSDKVLVLLRQIPRSNGIISYLMLIKKVLVAFCNPETNSNERLKSAVFCVEFLRLWKQDCINKGHNNKDSHFVTQNIFDGIELNLIMIISLIINAKEKNIHQMSSQVCENFFRLLRSFTTIESTVVNFTLKGIISRMEKILFVENVSFKLRDVMHFENLSEPDNPNNNNNQYKLSMNEIQNSICAGRIEAKNEARSLKMCQEVTNFKDIIKPIKVVTNDSQEENTDDDDSGADYFEILNNTFEYDEQTVTFSGMEFSNVQTGS